MGNFDPIVSTPASHLLVIRYLRRSSWAGVLFLLMVVAVWYLITSALKNAKYPAPSWLVWTLDLVPVAVVIVFYRWVIELVQSCFQRYEYVFDATARTLSHNGRMLAEFRDIRNVVFRTYTPPHAGEYDSVDYTVKLLMRNGSKIYLLSDSKEKPLLEFAQQVAAFLGVPVVSEYAESGKPILDSIKSLDLTQQQFDREREEELRFPTHKP